MEVGEEPERQMKELNQNWQPKAAVFINTVGLYEEENKVLMENIIILLTYYFA